MNDESSVETVRAPIPFRAGQGTKFDARRKAAYLELLSKGIGRYAAAKAVGVTGECVRLHALRDPIFQDEIAQAEGLADDQVETAMYNTALDGSVPAQQFWLLNRRPDVWQNRRNVRVQVSAVPPEDVQAFVDGLARLGLPQVDPEDLRLLAEQILNAPEEQAEA